MSTLMRFGPRNPDHRADVARVLTLPPGTDLVREIVSALAEAGIKIIDREGVAYLAGALLPCDRCGGHDDVLRVDLHDAEDDHENLCHPCRVRRS